jgi:hypothetical protein
VNSKNIKKHLKAKLRDWTDSITDPIIKETIMQNTIITGGALVSLLTGEPVNDYDVYFRTKESCITVAKYYIDRWNTDHPNKHASLMWGTLLEEVTGIDNGQVKVYVKSKGVADEDEISSNTIACDFETNLHEDEAVGIDSEKITEQEDNGKGKYRPRFITSNAITLSNKIQIVTRFYGEVADIHKNYDFAHCTCAWSSWDNEVFLPRKALECIINKELYYVGSQYPLCSIIRTRKYIERGYHINAGQYVKMAMQLNALDLTNVDVLEDQLTGVDTAYFQMMINALKEHKEETGNDKVDMGYAMELISKLF